MTDQAPYLILILAVIVSSGIAYNYGPELLLRIAQRQWEHGKITWAAHIYSFALLIWPHRPDFMILRGYCQFELGRAPQGLKDFERAVQQNPERAATYRSLGHVYASYEHNFDQAMRALDRAITLAPAVIDAYLERAKLRVCRQRDLEAALNDCDQAIQVAEPEFRKHREFGSYIPHGQAISQYFSQRLVKLYSLRAHIYARRGEADMAQADLVNAETLNQVESILFRAGVLLEQKNYAALIDVLQPLATSTPARWEVQHLLGIGYYGLGNHEAARAAYNRAIDLAPKVAVLYNNRAENAFTSGAPAQALADFQAALSRYPTMLHAQAGEAITLHVTGEIELARTSWHKLIKRDERFADADWVGQRLDWTPALIEQTRRLIGDLELNYDSGRQSTSAIF